MVKKSRGEEIKSQGEVKLDPRHISELTPLDTIDLTQSFLLRNELDDTTADLTDKSKKKAQP